MTQRWSYARSVGRTQYQHTVTLDGDTVTSDHPDRLPNPRVTDIRVVFEQGAFFEASDPKVRFELMAAIAERLSASDFTRALDQRRLAYWRAYDPARVRRERFAYVRLRSDRSVERVCDWLVDAHGVFTTSPYGGGIEHHLPDEVYLCGPPSVYAPAWHRAHLRGRLRGALKREDGVAIDHGFRAICYRSTPKRDWSWDQNDSGESFAATEPGAVTVGYRYGHDYGLSLLVPERVLSEPWATRISLGWPKHVGEQARAALIEAGEEPSLVLDASVSECAEAYAKLGPKLDWHAPWPHAIGLDFKGYEAVAREQQWQESAAFGLFASLCPDKRLSHPCSSDRANVRSLYNRSSDDLWLSTDGAAVLRAHYCFGAWAGGIDERWHVMPSPDRRAIFSIGTDYSQSDFFVVLGADTAEALSELRAHCEAYFAALGLGECVAKSLVGQ